MTCLTCGIIDSRYRTISSKWDSNTITRSSWMANPRQDPRDRSAGILVAKLGWVGLEKFISRPPGKGGALFDQRSDGLRSAKLRIGEVDERPRSVTKRLRLSARRAIL